MRASFFEKKNIFCVILHSIMNEVVYLPNENETAIAFVKRVVAEQSNREPLRIVVQLVEIALGELHGRPCDVRITSYEKCLSSPSVCSYIDFRQLR